MDAFESTSAATNKSHRNQQQNRTRREIHQKTHSLNKRPVCKPFNRKCDIYVSNKSNFQVNKSIFIIFFLFMVNRKQNNKIERFCLGSDETMSGDPEI